MGKLRPNPQTDPRSFVQLRHDLRNSVFSILCLSGIELEQVLIREQKDDKLTDIYLLANEAMRDLHIMFGGGDGTEESNIHLYEKTDKDQLAG